MVWTACAIETLSSMTSIRIILVLLSVLHQYFNGPGNAMVKARPQVGFWPAAPIGATF